MTWFEGGWVGLRAVLRRPASSNAYAVALPRSSVSKFFRPAPSYPQAIVPAAGVPNAFVTLVNCFNRHPAHRVTAPPSILRSPRFRDRRRSPQGPATPARGHERRGHIAAAALGYLSPLEFEQAQVRSQSPPPQPAALSFLRPEEIYPNAPAPARSFRHPIPFFPPV